MAKKASIKYETKELVSDEELDGLYDGDALTIEGLATKSIPDLLGWIKQYTTLSANCVVYIIKGKAVKGLEKEIPVFKCESLGSGIQCP